MLNNKCLLCAITLFPLSAAKIAIFVISSLQKTFFFTLKYAKTLTSFMKGNKNRFLGSIGFSDYCKFAPVFNIKFKVK